MRNHPALWIRAIASAFGIALAALGTSPLQAQDPAVKQAQPAAAEPRSLSLTEALRIAESQSEEVAIARAAVTRARGDQMRARSQFFPQLYGSASYTRTLASEFEALRGSDTSTAPPPPPCTTFVPNPSLPVTQRLDSLERAVECAQNANPFAAFGNLPFGQANQWRLGLSASQTLFAGGRIVAQNRAATAGRRVADVALTSARAQLLLDVIQAYYDAALSDRLFAIAQATYVQAETTLKQTQLARQVGTQPEFELLRAQVTRDNQRPVVIQRQSERDIAYLRLKQLLNLPLDQDVSLATELGDTVSPAVPRLTVATATLPDTAVSARAPVRQATENVTAQEALLRVARAERVPSLSLTSDYGRVAYPGGGLPDWGQFRSNWTVGVSLRVPLITGGAIRGDELVARANLEEARARLEQTRELAQLDSRNALAQLQAA
ncbi:MAG: TolC family protein, partial [Chloroflexota bacterium]|nr:TolC family protein [Chloroflexota bacterium]